ncbi:MAG: death-on-curing family protein [Bacteroidetes bacterium]|nr:death-on-curing family protein [Bacteroidota bacterium]
MFKYLNEEHIKLIHKNVIQEFGGSPGLYDYTDGRISGIIAQQYPVFGHDKYPTVFQKAAMLLYFLAKGHCFVDGNKRVAIDATIVFLLLNGYQDLLEDMEGYFKTSEIAGSKIPDSERDEYINSIAEWLSENFKLE